MPRAKAEVVQSPLVIEIGKRIKKEREESGWSQVQLAQEAKIQQQQLSDLERGKGNPTVLSLEKIAKALSVGLKELIPEGL